MIDWSRIAELLTEKWYAEGKLPVIKGSLEYNYVFATDFTLLPNDWLRYARTEICENSFGASNLSCVRVHGMIDKNEAIRETWPLLTSDEKTTIMVETLGSHANES